MEKFDEFLKNHKVLNMGYMYRGFPQSCALWYAHDSDLNLYYLSAETTKHGSLHRGSAVSFTINKDDQDWQQIRGIQGTGMLFPTSDKQHWEVYTQKFPFVLEEFPDLDTALQKSKLWIIRPNWIRLIDNTIAFGHKEEITL